MRYNTSILSIFVFIFIFFPFGVLAQDFEDLFKAAAAKKSVSQKLAMAIAHHESGMNPFAVNVAGRSYMPKTKETAAKIILAAHQRGVSYDVGLMQVNSQWIRKWNIDPLSLLDPETNIETGIKILAAEIQTKGFSWEAVGAYHSPKPVRARQYAWLIYKIAQNKFGLNKKTQKTSPPSEELDDKPMPLLQQIIADAKYQQSELAKKVTWVLKTITRYQTQSQLIATDEQDNMTTVRVIYRGRISRTTYTATPVKEETPPAAYTANAL